MTNLEGPVHVTKGLSCDAFTPPQNSVGDTAFASSDPLTTAKQHHLHVKGGGQPDGGSPYDEIRFIHTALNEGEVTRFQAGLRDTVTGDSDIAVDLYKNGVSILSAVIHLTSVLAPDGYDQVIAGISPTLGTYTAGDVFEVVITTTLNTGSLGEGLFFQAVFNESQF